MPRSLCWVVPLMLLCSCRSASDEGNDGILVAQSAIRTITPSVTVIGTMEYARPVDVSTEVTGRIMRTYVSAGDLVQAGDPLALIDTVPLVAAVSVARVHHDKAVVATERARYDSAEAAEHATMLHGIAERASTGASRIELEKADRASARAALSVRDARLAVELATLTLIDAERARSRAVVRAPFKGMVVRILSPSGAVAVTGTATAALAGIARIASADSVWIRLKIPVQHILGVKRGQTVVVRSLESSRMFRDTARVLGVDDTDTQSAVGDDGAGGRNASSPTVTVLAVMPRTRVPPDWPMGVPVEARLQTGDPARGVAVPLAAILPAAMAPGGREGVWAIENDVTRFVPLTSGPDDGVWAMTSLKPGISLTVAVGSTATLLMHGEGQRVIVAGSWTAP